MGWVEIAVLVPLPVREFWCLGVCLSVRACVRVRVSIQCLHVGVSVFCVGGWFCRCEWLSV